jgi:hypothetical protein
MPDEKNDLWCIMKKYKWVTGLTFVVPFILVILIFAPSPKGIVYADLDKRYAMNEQVQQQLKNSETNILLVFNLNRLDQVESEIFFLDKLKADGRATSEDIARLNSLLRLRGDIRKEINSLKSHE